MKATAEEYQGKKLTEAVITIPSAFSTTQKAATISAAKIAGWQTIHLLPEPIAAAFAYSTEIDICNQSNILIFDLGGGTVDICIAKVTNAQLEILADNGDLHLGGRNFDKLLINHFDSALKYKHNLKVLETNKKFKLMQKCQEIKHNLSKDAKDW